MNYKKIIMLIVLFTLLGFGCRNNTIELPMEEHTEEQTEEKSIIGTWVYSAPNEKINIDQDSVSLEITGLENMLHGKFIGVGIYQQNARYITEGDISMINTKGDINRFNAVWTGSRGDSGSAIVTYDPETNSLTWYGNTTNSDGLYTLPEEMYLRRETAE